MNRALVQLGRYGDILNILPPVYESFHSKKQALGLMVAGEFAPILEGLSYVEPMIFPGTYDELQRATALASLRAPAVAVSQVYGKGLDHRWTTESYMRDSWDKVGVDGRWEQLPLLIDRRSEEREERLAATIDWSRPVVLTCMSGRSSPFARAPKVRAEMVRLMPEVNFVELPPAEKFFDLLGLFDRAHALVTVDTGPLHLAAASAVPVVALVNPKTWYGSLRKANHLLHRSYRVADPEEIVAALRRTLRPIKNLVHLYPTWDMSPEDRARHELAKKSWTAEYGSRWQAFPVEYKKTLSRDSGTVLGDPRPVPFLKDVFQLGLQHTRYDDDVIVISNTDVGFSPGLTEKIRRLVLAKGSAYCYRADHKVVARPLDYVETVSGGMKGGLDLFAFTRKWVEKNFDRLPDMVFGRTLWDLVYRDLVKMTGGGELYGGCWHEDHVSFWKQNDENVGNLHNEKVAEAWRETHDTTRPYRYEYEG